MAYSYPGGYGGAPQYGQPYGQPGGGAYPPTTGYVDPQVASWFYSVDADRSGQISAPELQRALMNSNWAPFNLETCWQLIGMFDKDLSGSIGLNEFQQLWQYVQQWRGHFERVDSNRSGSIDANELFNALGQLGYRVSQQFTQMICMRFDIQTRRAVSLDSFIQVCALLRQITDGFRARDATGTGFIQLSYDDFMCQAIVNKP